MCSHHCATFTDTDTERSGGISGPPVLIGNITFITARVRPSQKQERQQWRQGRELAVSRFKPM